MSKLAIVSQGARCDIRDRDWPTPRRPKSCHLDYGNGMIVGWTGRGTPACAGNTVLDPAAPALGYGRSISFSGFTCTSSATNGITCRRRSTGHGFTISIQRYRLF